MTINSLPVAALTFGGYLRDRRAQLSPITDSPAMERNMLRRLFLNLTAGELAFETTAFAIGGADGLTMLVFSPAGPADAAAITAMLLVRSA